jgi:hypothetical protein
MFNEQQMKYLFINIKIIKTFKSSSDKYLININANIHIIIDEMYHTIIMSLAKIKNVYQNAKTNYSKAIQK